MATLYRNFPSRRDVLEALFADEVDALLAAAQDTTLLPWLRRFFTFLQSKHPIGAELLDLSKRRRHRARARPPPGDRGGPAPLVTAAQRSGAVRDDLTVEQILAMVKAIARVPGDPAYVEPILEVTLDGLRPRGRSTEGHGHADRDAGSSVAAAALDDEQQARPLPGMGVAACRVGLDVVAV